MAGKEKKERSQIRYIIDGCKIQYKPEGLMGLLKSPSVKYIVLDISEGGVQFISKEKFKLKSSLSLNISAPFLKDDVINAKGTVAWVREAPGLQVNGVGIKFDEMDPANKARLKMLLASAAKANSSLPTDVQINSADNIS
ncbi:MAG: PilZ domain-containing protein [Planctomycetes bacterium]|nr:PilZ domain-containing protein [Planctomycetota bacterium]